MSANIFIELRIFTAYAITCWKCTSIFPYTFCNDPFNATAHHKSWAYDECSLKQDKLNAPNEKNLTASCRKLILRSKFEKAFIIKLVVFFSACWIWYSNHNNRNMFSSELKYCFYDFSCLISSERWISHHTRLLLEICGRWMFLWQNIWRHWSDFLQNLWYWWMQRH